MAPLSWVIMEFQTRIIMKYHEYIKSMKIHQKPSQC